ncbi:TetR/AcrR family transcriptional regulator C-terminal domain-containing protein [Streptomyces toxytricini]|uniref:TetR/AcrR family transcriptional regulator C-terminal domain-containing protein n=1 Tax=Streptomyces toxytricini TaxID=67369 RepID=A0ABW8EMY8_STRT5
MERVAAVQQEQGRVRPWSAPPGRPGLSGEGDARRGRPRPPPPPPCDTDDWHEGLQAWARAQRGVYRRRPWLARLPVTGPPSGSRRIAWTEAALAVLDIPAQIRQVTTFRLLT